MVHTLPHPMGHLAPFLVRPTQSLKLVPMVHLATLPVVAVVGCAPTAAAATSAATSVASGAVATAATRLIAAPTAAATTSAATSVASFAVPTPKRPHATSAIVPAAMVAVLYSVVPAVSPSCMDSRDSVRCLTRTRQRVVPRCCMGARSNPHPPTGYTSLMDRCEA